MAKRRVGILVLDVNDNSPLFSKDIYEFMIKEEQPIGTTLGKVIATDKDLGDAGVVTYQIKGPAEDAFKILEVCN